MKTFTDVKRRMEVGKQLLTVKNTYRPVLDNTVRTITKVQTNGFGWSMDGCPKSYTPYPKASGVMVVDPDTFRLALFDEHYVELKFL